MSRLTILTDFGTRDGYVGAMKGVIAGIAPDVAVDDIAHDVEQGDVAGAMWALARYGQRYPRETVHVVVVDPGVGTDRRAVAVVADGRFYVAPDNGVLTLVLARAARWAAVEIRKRKYLGPEESATFHGRDVFAPAAAHLAAGTALGELGPDVSDPRRIALPEPRVREGTARGEVVHVDRFGNAAVNVPGAWSGPACRVEVPGRDGGLEVRETYGDVAPGEALALVNSAGWLEVAVRDGSAAETLDLDRGSPVRVTPVDAPDGATAFG